MVGQINYSIFKGVCNLRILIFVYYKYIWFFFFFFTIAGFLPHFRGLNLDVFLGRPRNYHQATRLGLQIHMVYTHHISIKMFR